MRQLPIPKEVSGPFRTRTCFSPNGDYLLVGGRPPFAEGILKVMFNGGSRQEILEFVKNLGQMIYVSNILPEKQEDYQLIVKITEPCFILSMAVSQSNRLVTFLLRESWMDRKHPIDIEKTLNKNTPVYDVLYTVSIDGGNPTPLAFFPVSYSGQGIFDIVIRAGVDSTLEQKSICWHRNEDSVFCRTNNGISRVFLDGSQKKIFDTQKQYIASTLLHNEDGLQFISFPWNNYPSNLSPETTNFSLVTINDNGSIKSEKIPPFVTGFNGYLPNTVLNESSLINIPRWTDEDLCFGLRKIVETQYNTLYDSVPVKSPRPFLPEVCQAFSEKQGVFLLTAFTDFRHFKDNRIAELIKNGGADFTQFYLFEKNKV
jgi:hypothetical protein